MTVTISHNKGKEAAMEVIDHRIAEAQKNLQAAPVEILNLERSWQGSTLNFSFTAKKAFLKGPIKGTVEVADTSVVVTVDLGVFQRFIPEGIAQEAIKSRMRELLA